MIEIVIKGPTKSGKSALQALVGKALRDAGLKPTLDWGSDGKPEKTKKRIKAIIEKAPAIKIVTEQTNRADRG